MVLIWLALVHMIFFSWKGDEPENRSLFISPVKIPIALSANFGELRPDHFHSGIDVKTQGVTGKEVVAAASGYIYRISVSPGGFGKALYMRHSSGYSTVYGHLDRFTPEIEKYVESRQYEEKSFMITLWPAKDKFYFEQGELIAYSGNSGSSSGPHLHYEIRKSGEEVPVNPLLFDFGVEDNVKPVIERLAVYPLGSNSTINNVRKPLRISVAGGNGNYYIPSGQTINISGSAGFGIKSYDILNSSYNKCSSYSIELIIDSISVFNYKMDSFGFDESKYVNSHIDYEAYIRDKAFYERTFILPNDKLSVYGASVNRGIFSFRDNKKHRVEIVISDLHGNKSRLIFSVKGTAIRENSTELSQEDSEAIIMPYGRNNKFISGNVTVNIPSGSLYDTLWFRFSKSAGLPGMYSDLYHIHNKYTPLHKPFHLSIKPGKFPEGKQSKLLILQISDDRKKTPLATNWEDGVLTARPGTMGDFCVGFDTIKPTITPVGFVTGADLGGMETLKVRIKDELSGIKSYYPVIDSKWALFEYDQKNDMLIFRFDPERIRKGSKHSLSLTVSDNRDNKNTFECEFTW